MYFHYKVPEWYQQSFSALSTARSPGKFHDDKYWEFESGCVHPWILFLNKCIWMQSDTAAVLCVEGNPLGLALPLIMNDSNDSARMNRPASKYQTHWFFVKVFLSPVFHWKLKSINRDGHTWENAELCFTSNKKATCELSVFILTIFQCFICIS